MWLLICIFKLIKISNLSSPDSFFSSSKCTKTRFRPGLRPGSRWGSLQRSPRPHSWLGRGIPPPHSPPPSTPSASRTRRLWRLDTQAPLTQFPGYATELLRNIWYTEAESSSPHNRAEFNHESMHFHNVSCQNSTYFQHDAQHTEHSIIRSNPLYV